MHADTHAHRECMMSHCCSREKSDKKQSELLVTQDVMIYGYPSESTTIWRSNVNKKNPAVLGIKRS